MIVYPFAHSPPSAMWPSSVAIPYTSDMSERVLRSLLLSAQPDGFVALALACPENRGGSGSWVPSRSAPRFLDAAWEVIQRARHERKMRIRVLGLGPHTDDTIARYPWDAIVCADPSPEALAANRARWRNRWWP